MIFQCRLKIIVGKMLQRSSLAPCASSICRNTHYSCAYFGIPGFPCQLQIIHTRENTFSVLLTRRWFFEFIIWLILLLVRYYANFLLATFIWFFMLTRFGSCVGHSANSILLETQLESSNQRIPFRIWELMVQ